MNDKEIDDLVWYVMNEANKCYSDDFPIPCIEEWIRNYFNEKD